jgi:hypothetical protein
MMNVGFEVVCKNCGRTLDVTESSSIHGDYSADQIQIDMMDVRYGHIDATEIRMWCPCGNETIEH